jgi:carboxymethylenebutenolidase
MAETATPHKLITTETKTLSVPDGTEMSAYIARPQTDGPHPGLIVLQEAFGVNAHIRDVTERFARAGYTAIAPDLFHRTCPNFEGSYTDFSTVMPHMQALTNDGLASDCAAAYEWLTSETGGATSAVGSVGYCLGGRVSFLANITLPLKAAVSYYGSNMAKERASEMHGPMMLIWGGLDKHIGTDIVRGVEDALISANKNYIQVVFSQADHGFFCDQKASYNPEAARQSWALTLEFFATYLQS